MRDDEDFLEFADEDEDEEGAESGGREDLIWHLLIVDDEPEVHSVTKLALKGFSFNGRTLDIDSAYSALEAKEKIRAKEYAVILLDVVMETDHAGLDLVHWIRREHGDLHVRIVLRTGQPGQAPEGEVISTYDINDYKEKTELTSSKLNTLMYSSLRAYQDIVALYRNKLGLESIVVGADRVFRQKSLKDFTQGALEQLTVLLKADEGAFYGKVEGLAATQEEQNSRILAATGAYSDYVDQNLQAALTKIPESDIHEAIENESLVFGKGYFIGVYHSHLERKNILFIDGIPSLSMLDERLLKIFCNHLGLAFDNFAMHEEIEKTQKELVYRLSEAVESRSKETSNHVKRMAHTCKLLGEKIGLSKHDIEVLFMAAPLHDVGKIAIPDSILNKPGKLTEAEWEVMQKHASIGHDILKGSKLEILNMGAIIAGEHHEKWDGSGYPIGKSGDEIHIFGRIAAVSDVFDALFNNRCYKEAWPIDQVIQFIEGQKGRHFDPQLVDLIVENIDEVINIQNRFPD